MIDVVNRAAHAVHDADVQDVVVVFREPVLFGCRLQVERCRLQDFARRVVSEKFYLFICELLRHLRKKLFRNGFVHEQGLRRVADAGALHLGVHGDFLGHFQVGIGVHKNVAHAFVMFDDGNFAAIRHRANQTLAAARHAQINILRERKQSGNRLAVGRGHNLNRVLRKTAMRDFARVNHGLGDDLI